MVLSARPRRGPRQDKPGQRVGLERGELVRPGRSARLAQIVNDRKGHPHHLVSVKDLAAATSGDVVLFDLVR